MRNTDVELQKIVGRVIRAERLRRGLKFTLFCYEHEIPTTTLYMIEQGNRSTGIETLFTIVKALGLSLEEFGALVDKELAKIV